MLEIFDGGGKGGGVEWGWAVLGQTFQFYRSPKCFILYAKKKKNVNFHFGVIFISLLPWCL